MDTYVHEGIEVKKTGRTAIRKLRQREMGIVEITPVDSFHGDWKKWVDPVSLFVVQVPEGACCSKEDRDMNGGCRNCGDPCI